MELHWEILLETCWDSHWGCHWGTDLDQLWGKHLGSLRDCG